MSGARPSWSVARAATECGISVSTIKRRLRDGKFPNATQNAGGSWTIPIQDLIGAGLTPGKPAPPDPVIDLGHRDSDLGQRPRSEELLNRVSELEQELKLERQRREYLEILLKERADHVDSLKQAMRILEPGQRPRSESQLDPVSEPPAEPAPATAPPTFSSSPPAVQDVSQPQKRRWWQRG